MSQLIPIQQTNKHQLIQAQHTKNTTSFSTAKYVGGLNENGNLIKPKDFCTIQTHYIYFLDVVKEKSSTQRKLSSTQKIVINQKVINPESHQVEKWSHQQKSSTKKSSTSESHQPFSKVIKKSNQVKKSLSQKCHQPEKNKVIAFSSHQPKSHQARSHQLSNVHKVINRQKNLKVINQKSHQPQKVINLKKSSLLTFGQP